MGTQIVAPGDIAPQPGVVLSLQPLASDTREVLRCPHCQLTQYRTANHHCRRCRCDVDVIAAPPPPVIVAVVPSLAESLPEPGIETAEATGTLVPDVAGAIRNWRQHCGMSQRQLAERMRVPRTYVSKIENDKATPTVTSLTRMATAMDTHIAALLAPDDGFVAALRPLLARLDPQQRQQLLSASRRMAQA